MSTDLIKQLRDALDDFADGCAAEKYVRALLAKADAHLRTVPDTPSVDLDRIATLERENAELKVWVARWKQLAETNARIVERDKKLREIDFALQPKEPNNVDA